MVAAQDFALIAYTKSGKGGYLADEVLVSSNMAILQMKNDTVKCHSSHILNINPECKLETVPPGGDMSIHITHREDRSNGIIPLAGGQGD